MRMQHAPKFHKTGLERFRNHRHVGTLGGRLYDWPLGLLTRESDQTGNLNESGLVRLIATYKESAVNSFSTALELLSLTLL
jgi:hypothetical protein